MGGKMVLHLLPNQLSIEIYYKWKVACYSMISVLKPCPSTPQQPFILAMETSCRNDMEKKQMKEQIDSYMIQNSGFKPRKIIITFCDTEEQEHLA